MYNATAAAACYHIQEKHRTAAERVSVDASKGLVHFSPSLAHMSIMLGTSDKYYELVCKLSGHLENLLL